MREMKDSGVEWIGQIPKDWKIKKPKYIGSIRSGDSVTNKKLNDDIGYEVLGGNGTIGFYDKYNVDGTHIIIGRVGALCGNSRITRGKKFISDNALIYTCFEGQAENYINYIFDAFNLNKLNTSNAQPLITGSKVLNIFIPYPNIIEQKIIADFLDSKCSEIDATAEDIQKEISLLEDYKKSVITEAVTKGLNPDAEMKDSGIEWIGQIPKDWKTSKLKYLTTERSESALMTSEDIYIGLENVASNKNEVVEIQTENLQSIQNICKKDDVMFSKLRPYLNKVVICPCDCFCTSEFIIYKCFEGDNRYLRYFLTNAAFIDVVTASTYGTKMPRANPQFIKNLEICYCDLEEQQQIADFLDTKCSEIDAIIADKKRQRGILAEYKKSLIYEYVTGKKEVPINE